MKRLHRSILVIALAAVISLAFHSLPRAATVVQVSATGATDQQFVVSSGIPRPLFSIGNWTIAGLTADIFSSNRTGQSVWGTVASMVPLGSGFQELEILVSTNFLYVGNDVTGAGTPPGTPIQVGSAGEVTGAMTLNTFGATSYLSNSNTLFDMQQLIGGGAANNPSPGSFFPIFGKRVGIVDLFEEQPFSMTTRLYFSADRPGVAAFQSTASVVPLPASLPLIATAFGLLGFAGHLGRRRRPMNS